MPNTRHLPDWINGFMDFTEESEPPRLFRLWTAISVVAAALQRKCCLRWGTLDFYPNLYIVLVAPSGKARKGTAMIPGLKLLKRVGIKLAANATTRESLIRELKMSGSSEVDPEVGSVDMHASLTVFSKELTVFLGYQNRELMANLTDWYDCDDTWIYRTKTQGIDDIRGVWLNLIGATTPDLIQTSMPRDAIGGGLTSRMIFIYEREEAKMVIMPPYGEKEKAIEEKLQYDLDKIHMLKGDFKITKEFLELYTDWRVEQKAHPPFDDPRLAGYVERRPAHVLKTCMSMSASRNSKMVITKEDLQRTIEVLNATERKMPLAFSGVGKSPVADTISSIMAVVANRGTVTLSELMNMYYYDVDRWMMDKIVNTLHTMDFVSMSHKGDETVLTYKREKGGENGNSKGDG